MSESTAGRPLAARVHALIAQWRYRQATATLTLQYFLTVHERHAMEREARMYAGVADELEAALAAAPSVNVDRLRQASAHDFQHSRRRGDWPLLAA